MRTKKEQYNDMWQILGIDNAPARRPNLKRWQKVITADGVVTADVVMRQHGMAVDNAFPTGTVNLNQINSIAIDNTFLGWGELSLLQQNSIINNICTILANSLTEKWIKLASVDESKHEKIVLLEKAIQKYNLKELLNIAWSKTLLLGTAYITPKITGDEDDLANPLPLENWKIKQGSLEAFYVVEPTWVVPVEFNMTQPRSPNFYAPQKYVVFGETLHASRMRRMVYIEPCNLTAPIYLFGGIPMVQQLLPYILDFLNTKKEIVKIVSRFNTSVLKTNLNALGGRDAYGQATTKTGNVMGRAQAFNATRNNMGLYLMDKDEDFQQIQINTTGLVDILQQQGELLSLFSMMPVSKLFGQSPRGMNATGEFDANNFNELIHSIQESKFRPILDYAIDLIQLSEFGEIDENITYSFVPIGELNETAQSNLKNDKVNRAVTLVQNGLAEPSSIMTVLKSDPSLELDRYEEPEDWKIDPMETLESE